MSDDQFHKDDDDERDSDAEPEEEWAVDDGGVPGEDELGEGGDDQKKWTRRKAGKNQLDYKRWMRQWREEAYRREGRKFPDLARQLALMAQGTENHFRFNGLPAADVIFCLIMRVYYYHFSARRLDFKLEEFQRAGYISKVPHFNTVLLHMRQKELTPLLQRMVGMASLQPAQSGMSYAVDSTKIFTDVFLRGEDGKVSTRDGRKLRRWIKLHIAINLSTLCVVTARATVWREQDVKYLRPLIAEAVDQGFEVKRVVADKAYPSKENYRFIESIGAEPGITFKTNSRMSKNGSDPVWDKYLERFRETRELETPQEDERILIEAVNWMIKCRFGRAVRGTTETAQFNEALLKAICHNLVRLIFFKVELINEYMPSIDIEGIM